MISNLLLKGKKLNKDEYLIVEAVLSKDEEELMKDLVSEWKHVHQDIEIHEERLKHWCGEE